MQIITKLAPRFSLLLPTRAAFCNYKYPYNINREEYANYLKKVEKAETVVAETLERNAVPRRKRRVYDRPKHDDDITNYSAWRVYLQEQMLFKGWAHGAPVAVKLQLQPKWVIHAFGQGLLPLNHEKSASLQFSFEDNNFSKFLLYQYRNTTLWAKNDPNYDYQNQENVPEKLRKQFRLDVQEFWKSEDYFEFRVNCSSYAERFKFKRWVLETVEAWKKKESYDEFINKKYGQVVSYNKKEDRKNFEPSMPAILALTPQHFNLPKKGEKLKEPKVELPKKLGEEYRIVRKKTETEQEQQKSEAQSKS